MKKFKKILISLDTDNLLMTEVKSELLSLNPKLKNVRMTREFIIKCMIEDRRDSIRL